MNATHAHTQTGTYARTDGIMATSQITTLIIVYCGNEGDAQNNSNFTDNNIQLNCFSDEGDTHSGVPSWRTHFSHQLFQQRWLNIHINGANMTQNNIAMNHHMDYNKYNY